MDDLTGDILSDNAARQAIMDVLERTGTPGFLRANILGERNMALRQSLQMLPNYDDAVKMMNEALQSMK